MNKKFLILGLLGAGGAAYWWWTNRKATAAAAADAGQPSSWGGGSSFSPYGPLDLAGGNAGVSPAASSNQVAPGPTLSNTNAQAQSMANPIKPAVPASTTAAHAPGQAYNYIANRGSTPENHAAQVAKAADNKTKQAAAHQAQLAAVAAAKAKADAAKAKAMAKK